MEGREGKELLSATCKFWKGHQHVVNGPPAALLCYANLGFKKSLIISSFGAVLSPVGSHRSLVVGRRRLATAARTVGPKQIHLGTNEERLGRNTRPLGRFKGMN